MATAIGRLLRAVSSSRRAARGGDGIDVCSGRRLSLRFGTSGGQQLRALTLQLVQEQLRRVGVEVVPVFGQSALTSGVDVQLFSWFESPDPTGFKDIFGCGGSQNFTGYCQRLVTSDLDEADRILDADQRARVLNRADRRIARDVPVIPLYQVPLVYAYWADLPESTRRPSTHLERGELVARSVVLATAVAARLLAVSGARGFAAEQTPQRGGTLVIGT